MKDINEYTTLRDKIDVLLNRTVVSGMKLFFMKQLSQNMVFSKVLIDRCLSGIAYQVWIKI